MLIFQKCNLTKHVKQKHEENMGETKDKTQDQAESDQKSSEANQVNIAIEENPKTTNDFKNQPTRKSTNKLQPVPISREAPISSSTEATKPSEAFLQTISSGMI